MTPHLRSARRFYGLPFCGLPFYGLLLLAAGCGGPPTVGPPSDDETAVETRTTVDAFLARAKTGKAGAGDVAVLLESLDARAADQGGPYVELRDSAARLKTLYEQKKPKAEIDAGLEDLKRKADALGGAAS